MDTNFALVPRDPADRNDSSASPEPSVSRDLYLKSYIETLAPGINLIVCPREVVRWDDFIKSAPPFSVALDGYVYGPSSFVQTDDGPYINFNHHEGSQRWSTPSSSAQVFKNIQSGMLDSFKDNGRTTINIFLNDADEDCCLAVWLLANHERVRKATSQLEPLLNDLIKMEDLLDTTAGACKYDSNSSLIRQMAWIFEPYVQCRFEHRIASAGGAEMAGIIREVGRRIDEFAAGRGLEGVINAEYDLLGGGDKWILVREKGPYARQALTAKPISFFVSLLDDIPGHYKYSIGKISPFDPVSLDEIYTVLNQAEGLEDGAANSWGGSDMIGGSPRATGSRLSPAEIERILNRLTGTCHLNGETLLQ